MPDDQITPDDIAELERLCDAATEGPWITGNPKSLEFSIVHNRSGRAWELARRISRETDAAFIAAARTALPRLLAEVKQLRDAITDCERATWHEGITPPRLATRIRRIAHKTLPAPPQEDGK